MAQVVVLHVKNFAPNLICHQQDTQTEGQKSNGTALPPSDKHTNEDDRKLVELVDSISSIKCLGIGVCSHDSYSMYNQYFSTPANLVCACAAATTFCCGDNEASPQFRP